MLNPVSHVFRLNAVLFVSFLFFPTFPLTAATLKLCISHRNGKNSGELRSGGGGGVGEARVGVGSLRGKGVRGQGSTLGVRPGRRAALRLPLLFLHG